MFIDNREVKHVDKGVVDAVHKERLGDSIVDKVDIPSGELICLHMLPVSTLRGVKDFL